MKLPAVIADRLRNAHLRGRFHIPDARRLLQPAISGNEN
jgi:hypothetical protein